MKRQVSCCCKILAVLLICIALFSQEKNKYGKYPADRQIPNIEKYPSAVQKLDSIKANFYWNIKHGQGDGNFEFITKDYMKFYASSLISAYMYYSNLDYNGYYLKYFSEAQPIGPYVLESLKKLPYPWGFLIYKKGILLVEIISDKKLPKKQFIKNVPKIYEYVLEAKVVDDIFNSCNEDTVFIRHSHSIMEEYSQFNKMNVLLTIMPRGTIQRADSVQYIYLTGTPDEFMFVNDNTIYDPNNVLGIDGKSYEKFRKELYDFSTNEGVRK